MQKALELVFSATIWQPAQITMVGSNLAQFLFPGARVGFEIFEKFAFLRTFSCGTFPSISQRVSYRSTQNLAASAREHSPNWWNGQKEARMLC